MNNTRNNTRSMMKSTPIVGKPNNINYNQANTSNKPNTTNRSNQNKPKNGSTNNLSRKQTITQSPRDVITIIAQLLPLRTNQKILIELIRD